VSTKRIRELAEYVRTHFPAGRQLAQAALLEASAIEDAAQGLVDVWGHAGDGNPAEVLIRAIATEASACKVCGEPTGKPHKMSCRPQNRRDAGMKE
jgi:hypothetical protein